MFAKSAKACCQRKSFAIFILLFIVNKGKVDHAPRPCSSLEHFPLGGHESVCGLTTKVCAAWPV